MARRGRIIINKRVLFVITEDWALISHRLHLVEAAINAGYEVALATRVNKDRKERKGLMSFPFFGNIDIHQLFPK